MISFTSTTLVLSIGEMVEEVSDSGLLADTSTLLAATLVTDVLLQAHPAGLRLVHADGRADEWKPPGRRRLLCAATNAAQVAVLLAGGELLVFSCQSRGLAELARLQAGPDATCLALAPVPPAALSGRFLAVGGSDRRVRLLDLDTDEAELEPRLASTQLLEAAVSSIHLGSAPGAANTSSFTAAVPTHTQPFAADGPSQPPSSSPSPAFASAGREPAGQLALFAGTSDGRFATSLVDPADGKLSAGRQRYLGAEPVRLFGVRVCGAAAVLALSARAWLCYGLQGQAVTMPLTYPALDHAAPFRSEQCPEGVVAVCGQTLRIWTLERPKDCFHTTRFPLRYTPRAMAVHPVTGGLLVAEAERNTVGVAERRLLEGDEEAGREPADEVEGRDAGEEELARKFCGVVAAEADNWASCVRLVEPKSGETRFLEELEGGLAAFRFLGLLGVH